MAWKSEVEVYGPSDARDSVGSSSWFTPSLSNSGRPRPRLLRRSTQLLVDTRVREMVTGLSGVMIQPPSIYVCVTREVRIEKCVCHFHVGPKLCVVFKEES